MVQNGHPLLFFLIVLFLYQHNPKALKKISVLQKENASYFLGALRIKLLTAPDPATAKATLLTEWLQALQTNNAMFRALLVAMSHFRKRVTLNRQPPRFHTKDIMNS